MDTKVAIGRYLFDTIEEAYEWLRAGNLDDLGSCETRLIDIDKEIEEIKGLYTPNVLLVHLHNKPYVMSERRMATAYRARLYEILLKVRGQLGSR